MLPVAVACSSFDSNENMLCTSSFVNDIMFSHNGAYGPESNMTHMFSPVRQAPVGRQRCCLVKFAWWQHLGQSLPGWSRSFGDIWSKFLHKPDGIPVIEPVC